jgi:TetR/AcrR family transcriptional regulator
MPETACLAPSKKSAVTAAPRLQRVRDRNQVLLLRAAERVFARAGFAGATVADIAREAGMPKANLHYYYPEKRDLYRAVLDNILALWLGETDGFTPDAEPLMALEGYIRAKMRFSRDYPDASRVFANEILHGAPEIGGYLRGALRKLVASKAAVIDVWISEGRVAPLDPVHLFFSMWAVTQTYADFDTQVAAVLGVRKVSAQQHADATEAAVALFLRAARPDVVASNHTSVKPA